MTDNKEQCQTCCYKRKNRFANGDPQDAVIECIHCQRVKAVWNKKEGYWEPLY